MGKEIERKFLVRHDTWRDAESTLYRQGYLSTAKERTVRVRVAGARATLTVKGETTGATRAEFEYEVPRDEAEQLLDNLCVRPLVEKRRHRVEHAGHVFEVDEFLGDNEGLVVAEVELEREDETVDFPHWLGEEVTGDARYYNVNLVCNPYSDW